jgi:hypothetical protein
MTQFASKYPVFHRMNEAKWAWLCESMGEPGPNWLCAKGAVWFKQEADRTMYLLRWA